MIIIGYPGVGKSSICGKDGIIDLESSLFHDWYTHDIWVEPYVRVAVDLHQQGYTVCVSSHEAVQNILRRRMVRPGVSINTNVAMIYPDRSLKDAWIERLKNRYYESKKCLDIPWIIEKNYKAWQRAIDHYDTDINGMDQCNEFTKYVISNLDSYDIRVAIDRIQKQAKL